MAWVLPNMITHSPSLSHKTGKARDTTPNEGALTYTVEETQQELGYFCACPFSSYLCPGPAISKCVGASGVALPVSEGIAVLTRDVCFKSFFPVIGV